MQIRIPDPAYTGSDRSRANFSLAVKLALGFVVSLWVIQLLNAGIPQTVHEEFSDTALHIQ